MIFRTYAQAAQDIREWSSRLPHFAAIAGIPASGTIIATMLARWRHCHYVELADLLAGKTPWAQPHRRNIPAQPEAGPVLIVDDTCWTGRTILELKERIALAGVKADISYGALYYGDGGKAFLDHPGRRLPEFCHTFEWNMLRDILVKRFVFDLDGVLCEDWARPDTGNHEQDHLHHLANARPLYRPCYPVKAIVTARLEKFREVTELWLKKNGIRYGELVMFEGQIQAREKYGHARHKADHYQRFISAGAQGFIESSARQARDIAALTGKPVLSIEGLTLYGGTEPDAWP